MLGAFLTQLPQLPQPGAPADTAPADTGGGTLVGRAAERLFADSLDSIPERIESWVLGAYASFLSVLPRLVVAVAAAAIIIAVTLWLRALARKGVEGEEEQARGRGVAVLGILIATTTAALIAGATRIAAAAFAFTIFYAIAAVLMVFRQAVVRRSRTSPEAVSLAITVIYYAVLVIGVVEALSTIGLNLGGVIAGIGILGIAIGFAAQDALSNVIAGFLLLWDESIHVGDWIRVEDMEGRVKRITLRSTRIETRDQGILVIPNKEITGSRLFNYSLRHLTRVRVPVDVNYDADIGRAREVMLAQLPDEDFISKRPEPVVVVTQLGDHGVRMELIFFIEEPREMQPLIFRMLERVLLSFREAEIEITYPHLNLHFRSGELALSPPGDGAQPGVSPSSSGGISAEKGP